MGCMQARGHRRTDEPVGSKNQHPHLSHLHCRDATRGGAAGLHRGRQSSAALLRAGGVARHHHEIELGCPIQESVDSVRPVIISAGAFELVQNLVARIHARPGFMFAQQGYRVREGTDDAAVAEVQWTLRKERGWFCHTPRNPRRPAGFLLANP
jgi:hypothetical protein